MLIHYILDTICDSDAVACILHPGGSEIAGNLRFDLGEVLIFEDTEGIRHTFTESNVLSILTPKNSICIITVSAVA